MQFSDFIAYLFATFIGSGTAIAAAAWLSKSFITQLLTRDLESHRNDLAKQLAEFNGRLAASQFEHQTRFSELHKKRADVVETLYDKIVTAQEAMTEMASPLKIGEVDKTQLQEAAAAAFNDFQRYFNHKRLYLGAAAADKCGKLRDMQRTAFIEFQGSQGGYSGGKIDHKAWVIAWEKVRAEIPAALRELEADFHRILGITD